ncbi:MEMO1 family [Massariosphaeria phaeospora]|uniref:MEMO1 family n=1 Tax=Massariosphaeria phaeospora TaxID=100035 RepID=A0A7C8MFF7_9PLEO|nr:MEMO1 family [Massariosphaeria phaeospora]
MGTRAASHAGSWYSDDKQTLSDELDAWLAEVPDSVQGIGQLSATESPYSYPVPDARAIIAPHAGYAYSGPTAAWAYKSINWSTVKRVFLIGPSHHKYFDRAVTTQMDKYQTPLGDLIIDKDTVDEIAHEWQIERMSKQVDEREHSLEMHLPYIYKMLSSQNPDFNKDPTSTKLVPIVVGSTSPTTEQELGRLLCPYLSDPYTVFVISSDFCHWGPRFQYTHYQAPGQHAVNLKRHTPRNYPIHESIKAVDFESMAAVESGSHTQFYEQIANTANTVCGRHPILVFMAAVEALKGDMGRFKFVKYDRSGLVTDVEDSSVSYCSAFAVLQ